MVCIVGPNDVGKSTLIKCILRLLKRDSGEVEIDGIKSSAIKQKELARVWDTSLSDLRRRSP